MAKALIISSDLFDDLSALNSRSHLNYAVFEESKFSTFPPDSLVCGSK
jgi:hypothetical protein